MTVAMSIQGPGHVRVIGWMLLCGGFCSALFAAWSANPHTHTETHVATTTIRGVGVQTVAPSNQKVPRHLTRVSRQGASHLSNELSDQPMFPTQRMLNSEVNVLPVGLVAGVMATLGFALMRYLRPTPSSISTEDIAIFPMTGTLLRPSPLFTTHGGRTLSPQVMPHLQPKETSVRHGSRLSMSLGALKTGIVGLPNVGKSTLFNALTGGVTAEAANYPFCTIDPNIGVVEVPDKRLMALAELSSSQKVVPATLEFVDIAGIVKGASKGEGMGNKFLSNIRECDAIVHVVRCFEDENVIHVNGMVDPVSDMDVINLELIFSDLEQVERRRERAAKDRKASEVEKAALDKLYQVLEAGKPARAAGLTDEERFSIKSLGLLTLKPMIYAANVPEDSLADGNEMLEKVRQQAVQEGAPVIVVSAQLEAELVELSKEERLEMLQSLGVDEENCGLKALVREAYSTLGLQTYFTTGPQESRAWTIRKGSTAPQAAGVIHGDFERGFIRAETIAYGDLIELGSEKKAREAGKVRSEGKEYVVQEADVMHFLFNV